MSELVSTGFGNSNLKRNLFIGLLIGIAFAVLINSTTFSLGVPSVPLSASDTARTFIQVIIAPIAEELIFTFIVLFFAYTILSKYLSEGGAFVAATLVTALAFSLFHYAAYTSGGYVAGTTPFISAFVFRILAIFLNKTFGIETGIITHAAINGALVVGQGLA